MAIRCLMSLFALIFTIAAQAQSPETPVAAAQRTLAAYGASITGADTLNAVSDGSVTLFSMTGPKATFDLKVIRKGPNQIQRIMKQPFGELRTGSDGTKTWSSANGAFFSVARGLALNYLESQTVRSVPTLLSSIASRPAALRDAGKTAQAKVIEAEDPEGRKTSYFIDDKSSLITRMEFQSGEAKDLGGRPIPIMDVYVFSDFRRIQGRMTPFKIERYQNTIKIEETQFTSVVFDAAVPADTFRP